MAANNIHIISLLTTFGGLAHQGRDLDAEGVLGTVVVSGAPAGGTQRCDGPLCREGCNMKAVISSMLVVLVLCVPAAAQFGPEIRTWTDSTGKHKVEAAYGGVMSGVVKLIKVDGTTIKVPLEKLSEKDQNWITDNREARLAQTRKQQYQQAKAAKVKEKQRDYVPPHITNPTVGSEGLFGGRMWIVQIIDEQNLIVRWPLGDGSGTEKILWVKFPTKGMVDGEEFNPPVSESKSPLWEQYVSETNDKKHPIIFFDVWMIKETKQYETLTGTKTVLVMERKPRKDDMAKPGSK
jgi:hypothetical protein